RTVTGVQTCALPISFRGFGGPQGMAVIETILSRAAEALQLEPADVRRRNFYGDAPKNLTPYHQEVRHDRMPRIWDELLASSQYEIGRASCRERAVSG